MSPLVPPRILNADDYALSDGVSRSIEMLAAARKISATSAFVTLSRWREDAARLRELRGQVCVGLHLNLTVGAPTGAFASLAPAGTLPPLGDVVRAALMRRIVTSEVRNEIRRQLDLFEAAVGHAPDHVDGHQHVHVLPVVRTELLDEIEQRYAVLPPLLRDPSEAAATIALRSPAKGKALVVKALAAGFRHAARARRLPLNTDFAGFSAFDMGRPFRDEIVAALDRRGETAALKIVMCHPGFPDDELARLDPITERRRQEHDALLDLAPPDATIWHPADTRAGRSTPDWAMLATGRVSA